MNNKEKSDCGSEEQDKNKNITKSDEDKKHQPFFGDHFELLNDMREDVKDETVGKDKTEGDKK